MKSFLTILIALIAYSVDIAVGQQNIGGICARLVNQTYANTTGSVCKYQFQETYKSSTGQLAQVYKRNESVIFAFPGIDGGDQDTQIILNVDLVPLVSKSTNQSFDQEIQVHEGFRGWALDFLPLTSRYIKNGTLVTMCGHSAGGAVTYILAGYLAATNETFRESIRNVVTFGSPRPGDGEFSNFWQKSVVPLVETDDRYVMFREQFRFIEQDDVITNLPPVPYRDVTESPSKVLCDQPSGKKCTLRDLHRMRLYLFSLEQQQKLTC